jgi:hypothetical protein
MGRELPVCVLINLKWENISAGIEKPQKARCAAGRIGDHPVNCNMLLAPWC